MSNIDTSYEELEVKSDVMQHVTGFLKKIPNANELVKLSIDEVVKLLIDNKMVEDEASAKILLIDSAVFMISSERADYPIKYYTRDEEVEQKQYDNVVCLTEEYIKRNM